MRHAPNRRIASGFALFAVSVIVCGPATAQPMADCSTIERQRDRDKVALDRQGRSTNQAITDLDEWTKANAAAESAAIRLGRDLFLAGVAQGLEHIANDARIFDQFLKDRRVPLYLFANSDARKKVEEALHAYARAGAAARTATAINSGLLAKDIWELFQSELGTIARLQAQGDTALRLALDDPQLQAYLKANDQVRVVQMELLSSFLTLAVQATRLEKLIGPHAALAEFIVEYGYEATKWQRSRRHILQMANLTEQQLTAVDGLKRQVERTVASLNSCRTAAATGSRPLSVSAAGREKEGRERNEAIVRAEVLRTSRYKPPTWTEEMLGNLKPRAFDLQPKTAYRLPQPIQIYRQMPQVRVFRPLPQVQVFKPFPQVQVAPELPQIQVYREIPRISIQQPEGKPKSKGRKILEFAAGAAVGTAMVYGAVKGNASQIDANAPKGQCLNPAYDEAIRQQQALLQRGDPLSVQASGALSHGGKGPNSPW